MSPEISSSLRIWNKGSVVDFMENLSFEDLRVHYGTGRSYTVSGEGRNRVLGYRTGKMCNAGDVEVSEWCQLVKDAIEKAGEKELFSQLRAFMSERNYTKASKAALEEEALGLHAARIFENRNGFISLISMSSIGPRFWNL